MLVPAADCVLIVAMSKNTGSTAFRRVDVDQFAEEKYEEDALPDDIVVIGPNEGEVQGMLAQYPSLLHSFIALPNS